MRMAVGAGASQGNDSMQNPEDKGTAPGSAPRPIDLNAGRRAFMRSVGLGAAGAAILAGSALAPANAATFDNDVDTNTGPSDVQILNFALNLEYLEAEFYLRAVGSRLSDTEVTGRGRLGGVIGGRRVPFATKNIRLYAEEIANDERAHVRFLRSALGDARVARPAINLRESFTAAARAAGLISGTQQFDAFANETNFLLAAFIFEDVGVTAYKGAARFIDNKDFLEAAAGLLAVEAYHAGEIRTILFSLGLFSQAQAISNARDSLDGSSDLDQGIGNANRANIVPTDGNGLAFSRTTTQVLNIVYLNPNTRPGGFLPNGAN
jgi:rubrerythrin